MATQRDETEAELVFKENAEEYMDPLANLIKKPITEPPSLNDLSSIREQKTQGIVIGTIAQVHKETFPCVLVEYPGKPTSTPLSAISTQKIDPHDIGREVALAFQNGDLSQPIILGFIEKLQPQPMNTLELADVQLPDRNATNVKMDGDQLTLSAKNEIVLKCGKSSITLTKSGKILLRGKYLLSRSSGVNRIKGGSVQIN